MDLLADLGWLRRAPGDFRQRCKQLDSRTGGIDAEADAELIDLANHALDLNQLGRLGKLAARRSQSDAGGVLARFKLGLIGSGTLSLIGTAIPGSGLRHFVLIDVVEAEYGRSLEQAMDPTSQLRSSGLDSAFLAFDYRDLHLNTAASDADTAHAQVEHALAYIKAVAESLRPSLTGPILVQTLVPPVEPLFGSLDATEASSPYAMVQALNRSIVEWVSESDVVLVDAARFAAAVGTARWLDPVHWHSAKLPVAPQFIPLLTDLIARTVAAIRGKTRKCLVLDLDNTVWGGVIGDDGLDGIVIGQGSAEGEAFLSVQRAALDLRARGIVIAISSKNDEAVAWRPFSEHPDMLLRKEHISVFQANWQDKATNIRHIAQSLNIGIDALVFLDDNPFERELIRRELPFVAVPELTDDPAQYATILALAGYFDAIAISLEDRKRAEYYKANAERTSMLASSTDLEGYLRSLDMVCTIRPFDSIGRARVAQLINKSNQFNLTTRRYTEAEIAGMENAADKFTMQVRLADKFGDNGMISVVSFDKSTSQWSNDLWLMSCRVLGRRVEEAVLAHVAAAALAEGVPKLVGTYLPTAKNQMVAGLYERLGFSLVESCPDGATIWELALESYAAPELPMKIDDNQTA
ncbi:HAD family hydrolase [Novosphingobium sp. Gsoil 351]|uniref:HAD-IIIC family phosphatase n=1 Tax=Novosphingobium sp. Gsoil 351 TaxID=2675225 RepID=UPI0012B4E134|nr:HAD-IIIC family phosphatase [Novosphingobium sp. Gsoil 351]QGN56144.1 HAD-IIIC family phosphatase [Novosphingobium sp. Gsoil 351]